MNNKMKLGSPPHRARPDYSNIVGLSEDEARTLLQERGQLFRVLKRDGKDSIGTCDVKNNRINVAVEDGIVTGVLKIG